MTTDTTNSTASAARPRIVVGIDGTSASHVAVRYAASEAKRIGAVLELVHGAPGLAPLGAGLAAMYPLTPAETRAIGTKILNHARKVAREVAGDTWEIRTTLLDGDPAQALTSTAHDALQIVVGGRRRSLVDRLVVGSVTSGLAGRATVPVIVVPEGWVPSGAKDVVAVGVRDPADSDALLHHALHVAAARSATLRIVHAWQLPALYDDLVATRVDSEVWQRQARTAIRRALRRVRPAFPHVPVDVHLVHAQPARALEEATNEADILVIAAREHAFPFGRLGGTGRALFRVARCPVEIMPPPQLHLAHARASVLDPELVS